MEEKRQAETRLPEPRKVQPPRVPFGDDYVPRAAPGAKEGQSCDACSHPAHVGTCGRRDGFTPNGCRCEVRTESVSAFHETVKPALDAGKVAPADDPNIPRRIRVDRLTPAELAIRAAVLAVEEAGCDVRLTDAVVLLSQAREKVADFVDGVNAPPISLPAIQVEAREATPASAPIPYSEGKKIYDQGWNDGIDHLQKILTLAVEQRLGR